MQSTMLRGKVGEKVPQVIRLHSAHAHGAAEAADAWPHHFHTSGAGTCVELTSPHTPAMHAAAAGHPVQRG